MNATTFALMATAATIGSLHTTAPDHWMPIAALARARRWTPARAARTTVLCGFGHVTVSAALAIAALFIGLGAIHMIGGNLERAATWLLIAFGLAYMCWGLWHSRHHTHGHARGGNVTEWSLFALYCADPCVAVMPMIIAAASAGWPAVFGVILAYEVATIVTMVALVAAAHAGARTLRSPWLDHYGDALAGAIIVCVGALVAVLGI